MLPARTLVGIGIGTVALVLILRKLTRRYRLPQLDMLVALIVAAVVAAHFGWSVPAANGKSLLSTVGNVPASLPRPHIPEIRFRWVKEMFLLLRPG